MGGEFLGVVPGVQPGDVASRYTVVGQTELGVLIIADDARMSEFRADRGRYLDAEPRANGYYRVHPLAEGVAGSLSRYGTVLDYDGENYLVRVAPDALPDLLRLRAMVSRVNLEPIVITDARPFFPPVTREPLIEAMVASVNPDSILAAVRRLQDYRNRYSPGDSCRAAAQWIAAKFQAYGCDTVYLQQHTTGHAPNVIGIKYGTSGLRNPYAIIDGHFDSYAASNAPGADDNASGTVAAIEACRVLRNYEFQHDMRFIAFSGEEFGLFGSDYYANEARNRGDSILGVFNFDMIAYVDAAPETLELVTKISNPPCAPFADFFIACADTYTTLLCQKFMVGDNQNSDHGPFWNNGYLAFCGIEDFWPVNPWYHTPGDTIGAGYNNNAFCTEVVKAGVAGLALICRLPGEVNPGWLQMRDLPLGDKAKGIKDGGALCSGKEPSSDTCFVYAFKGNNRNEFYRYNTATNVWITRDSIPTMNRLGKKKAVKKGSSLTFGSSGKMYATKGNNTLDFWQYDPLARLWAQLTDVPLGIRNCKEGVGTAAVKEGSNEYVYLLRGSGTFDFYRYDAAAGTWDITLPTAPAGPSGKPYKNGSCLAYDGGDTIFLLKGSYNEFSAYSISGRNWVNKDPLPLIGASGRKKKVKDGAGMAYFSKAVYALKGGNTDEFWMYNCADQKWYEQLQLPAGAKKVKGGGALCFSDAGKSLYAFRGNNTREFWKYWPLSAYGLRLTADRPEQKSVQVGRTTAVTEPGLRIAPMPFMTAAAVTYSLARPGNVSLRLYDATGRVVAILASGYHPAGEYRAQLTASGPRLSAGVYLLKYETGEYRTTRKLVIE
jgi:hypothetical protein